MNVRRHNITRMLALVALSACADTGSEPPADAESPQSIPASLTQTGVLENGAIDEASGLAASLRDPALLWTMNDEGEPYLYAIDHDGNHRGRLRIEDADNRDWEDLAAFTLDDVPYIAVADIGDNEARRPRATIYVVAEPDIQDDRKQKQPSAWKVEFVYEDGPRDAEAIAVDVENGRFLVLSKRDIPAGLYEVPLRPDDDQLVEARRLGSIDSLPQPTPRDVEIAPRIKTWHWQPSAMDIAADGSAALILTYSAVYYYARVGNEDWLQTMQRMPLAFDLAGIREAESAAFGTDSRQMFVTVEGQHAPLFQIDMERPASASAETVSIMTFNVQNLFDNVDDPGKDDKAYLAITEKQNYAHIEACNEIPVERWRDECLNLDWNDDAIDLKLAVLADAIRQIDGGADVIALQEVENLDILERLRIEHLNDLGYGPAILIEGQDHRGIDVAFLAKLPVVGEPVLHPIRFPDHPEREGDTRGILQATFELPDGELLTGFAVHFPAPFHPTAMREVAYERLRELRERIPDEHTVFAAGDFNTTSAEVRDTGILDRLARPHWTIAHELGCGDCRGTAYYARDDSWSFLDMVFIAHDRGGNATWTIRRDSVRVAQNRPAQVTSEGTPARFRLAERSGVSDHWPLVVSLEATRKQ